LRRAEAGLAEERAGLGKALHAPPAIALLAGRLGLLDEVGDLLPLLLPERGPPAGARLLRDVGGALPTARVNDRQSLGQPLDLVHARPGVLRGGGLGDEGQCEREDRQ
jgi:hypothetical protein